MKALLNNINMSDSGGQIFSADLEYFSIIDVDNTG
jgi:hypothetical protein